MVRPRAAIASATRIDQERHVVVDDADPHPPLAGLAADRFDRQRDSPLRRRGGDFGEELGGLALAVAA